MPIDTTTHLGPFTQSDPDAAPTEPSTWAPGTAPATDADGGPNIPDIHEPDAESHDVCGEPTTAGFADPDGPGDDSKPQRRRFNRIRGWLPHSPQRVGLLFGLFAITALAGLCGWLGFQIHRQHVADQQSAVYLQTGRQGALNLTTIDWQHADTDVQRILDSASGTFHDDFTARAKDFIDVVKQTQSHSEGSIVESGVESETPTTAKILVAVNVKTTQAGQPEGSSRGWRMRIFVEQAGAAAKISNVEFVA